MKNTLLVLVLVLFSANAAAQMDSFRNTKNIWQVGVYNKTGLLYEYNVIKVSCAAYEWQFCEGVWEQYEDSNWQVFVDYESRSVFVSRTSSSVMESSRRNTIRLADSVWDYLEEVQVSTADILDTAGINTVREYADAKCLYATEERKVESDAFGVEEFNIKNCLVQRLKLSPEELQPKAGNYIRFGSNGLKLDLRFDGFELIDNI